MSPRVAPDAGSVLRFLSARRGEKRTREDLFDRLYWLYCAALLSGFAALFLNGLLQAASGGVEPGRLLALGERLGPPALLLAFSSGLRWATWQGPVVFSEADVAYLVSSPVPRDRLVRGRLAWGLAAGGALGVGAGLALFAVFASLLDAAAAPLLAACALSLGALGLLVSALGWQAERSAALSRAVLAAARAVPPAALALALVPSFAPGGLVGAASGAELLSGPWGWALVPVLAACGRPTPPWPLAASLLAAATALAVAWAWATAGRVPAEELARRAGLRRALRASVYTTDFRGAALVGREASRRFAGLPRKARLARPRFASMAVPWRDAIWVLRNGGRAGWALAFCGGGMLAALAYPRNVVVIFAAVLLGYLGASRLVETMRMESDKPGASMVLPYRHGDLVLLHGLLPAALVAAVLAMSCAAGFVAGFLPAAALAAVLVLCVPAAAVLVCCAAVAAQRSRTVPVEVMQAAVAMGDLGGVAYLQWYAQGPTLALCALGVPGLALVVASQGSSAVPWGALLGSGAYLLLFAIGCAWWLKGRDRTG